MTPAGKVVWIVCVLGHVLSSQANPVLPTTPANKPAESAIDAKPTSKTSAVLNKQPPNEASKSKKEKTLPTDHQPEPIPEIKASKQVADKSKKSHPAKKPKPAAAKTSQKAQPTKEPKPAATKSKNPPPTDDPKPAVTRTVESKVMRNVNKSDAIWALGSLTFLLLLLTGAVLYTGLWKNRKRAIVRQEDDPGENVISVMRRTSMNKAKEDKKKRWIEMQSKGSHEYDSLMAAASDNSEEEAEDEL